jgi:hypothetical protein
MCFTEAQLNAIEERDAAASAAALNAAVSAAALNAAAAKAKEALKLREAQNTVVESELTAVKKTGPDDDSDSDFNEEGQPDATSPFVLGVGVVLLGAACSLGLASSMMQ